MNYCFVAFTGVCKHSFINENELSLGYFPGFINFSLSYL